MVNFIMTQLHESLLCPHWLKNWIWELCFLGKIHLNETRFMAPCSLCMCICHIDPTTSVEIWKESPEGLVKEGDTVELHCQGDGNPPAPIIFNREQVRIASFSLLFGPVLSEWEAVNHWEEADIDVWPRQCALYAQGEQYLTDLQL